MDSRLHSPGLIISEPWSPLYMTERIIKLGSVSPHFSQSETQNWSWNGSLRMRHVKFLVILPPKSAFRVLTPLIRDSSVGVALTYHESVLGGQQICSLGRRWVYSTAGLKSEAWSKPGSQLEGRASSSSWKLLTHILSEVKSCIWRGSFRFGKH